MNTFKSYHPLVSFSYFLFVIGFSCFFLNPVCVCISFFSGFIYSALLGGKKTLFRNAFFVVPMVIVAALINPAFNHEGQTILTYLPSGNPLTMESILYGIISGALLGTVICWFSCFNQIITSDKFIYLFGKIMPSLSLILSMTLRFIPKFNNQIKKVSDSRRMIGRDASSGKMMKRIKNGITILSIMITWSLENAIETADSMKSRGYGLKGRSAFSIFTFNNNDKIALSLILAFGAYIFIGGSLGIISFSFFPTLGEINNSGYALSLYFAYFFLCQLPIFIEITEELKWNALKSKI